MSLTFSIIVSFRNRDLERVSRCLDAIAHQTGQNFELIFVDYGSDKKTADKAKLLVESFSFARYIYSNTRGWFWNRAHALNIGIKYAKGEIVVIYDIDLIIESEYLSKVAALDFSSSFYTFSCFYLPKDFEFLGKNLLKDGVHYEQNYVGLCAIKKQDLLTVNGYSEYYMVWGAEDDDLYKRLSTVGLARKQLTTEGFKVFHQWHSTHSPVKPTLWYLSMVSYLHSQKLVVNEERGHLHTFTNRPLLSLLQNKEYRNLKRIQFGERPLLFFNPFFASFYELEPGETAWLEYEHQGKESKSFGNTIKNLLWLQNVLSPGSSITVQDIKEFFHYFIGTNRFLIEDYYISFEEDVVIFCVQKAISSNR